MFASLISAVDPVATLGVFGAMGVHPKLNAFVYGESILNDAVAIVAYKPALGTRARRNSVFLGRAPEAVKKAAALAKAEGKRTPSPGIPDVDAALKAEQERMKEALAQDR